MSIKYTAEKLIIGLDATTLAAAAAWAIVDAHRDRIPKGMLADGSGPQRVAIRNDANGIRGYDTGVFARSIGIARRRKRRKNAKRKNPGKKKASIKIEPIGMDNSRWKWLGRETFKLHVEYLHPGADGTPLSNEVDAAMQAALDEMIR